MYNQEIKEKFLEQDRSVAKKRRTVKAIFEKTGVVEERLQKDIAQFSTQDVQAFLDSTDIEGVSRLYTFRTVFRRYTDWCRENHIFQDVSDDFLEAINSDIDIAPRIAKTAFRDANDLLYAIQRVYNIHDGMEGPVLAALYWVGLTKPETFALTDDMVDLKNRVIYDANGIEIVSSYPDAIAEILNAYVSCNSRERANRTGIHVVYKDYSSRKFFKKFRSQNSKKESGEFGNQMQLDTCMVRLNDAYSDLGYPTRFLFSNIWKSGRCHALLELENSGVDVAALENRELLRKVYRGSKSDTENLWYYRAYKRAFNL